MILGTHPADNIREAGERLLASWRARDSGFRIGLAVAFLVHAALLVGMATNRGPENVRIMGERDGDKDTVAIDIVDASELMGAKPAPPPTTPSPASTPAPPEAPESTSEPIPEPTPEPAKPVERPTPKEEEALLAIDKDAVEPLPKPKPTPPQKNAATPSHEKSKQHQKTQPLQLSMPTMSMQDGSSGAVRPPGITRSGENDEFGRGVIRALKQTMPSFRGTSGRVPVRILLSEKGNLVEVRLIQSSGDPVLDQNVLFSVKQTNFPFPPARSTIADRTFLITYVYF